MIRGHDIDRAAKKLIPQALAFGRVTQRWSALSGRAEALKVFFGEEQIVGAGFDGDIRAAGARLQRRRDAAAGAHVDNVQLRAGLPRE